MRIAVIDDERPSRSELRHLIGQCVPEAQIDEADSGAKALELAAENHYDAMFVDVHLGDMEGTTLSGLLKKALPDVQIVFATAYDDYAVKAFDMDAADYVMKPFDPKRVARALERVKARLGEGEKKAPPDKLWVSFEKRTVLLDIADIAYIEADAKCTTLHARQGTFTSAQPLAAFEKRLQPGFFRAHKSYLINLSYVTELYPWLNGLYCVRLRGYETVNVPVSRKQVKPLRERFEL